MFAFTWQISVIFILSVQDPLTGYSMFIRYVVTCVLATMFYAGLFVILSYSHGPIGDFLEHHVKVPRSIQLKCLRMFGYIIALCIMVLVFYYGFIYSYL